jgi:3-hydroxybutyryl-CoA dehydrogenase
MGVEAMSYEIRQNGDSRSFPTGDAIFDAAIGGADIVLFLGTPPATVLPEADRTAILVELDTECLGAHTGESAGEEGSSVLGFARYRNGDDPPSDLIELVRQPNSDKDAIAAAKSLFESVGFTVCVCSDQAGRIIDRLVRPKYNDALRFLDEGLATAKDMDLTCCMGLGYPDGPIERVERGSMARHYYISRTLFETYGTRGFAPARRAVVAHARTKKEEEK